MCTLDCFKWAYKVLREDEIKNKRVIEVGSFDVNGSLRYMIELLKPSEYIGVDIENGPGVDIVLPAEKLVEKFGIERFDLVLSSCALEHIREWRGAISNMKNICKRGGIILIIVPSIWPFHEYPYDFWRYTKIDIENIFSDCKILILDEDVNKPSLIYAKILKLDDFKENNLEEYLLYSVIANKKILEIRDEDFNSFYYKYLVLKSKVKESLLRIGRIIFY